MDYPEGCVDSGAPPPDAEDPMPANNRAHIQNAADLHEALVTEREVHQNQNLIFTLDPGLPGRAELSLLCPNTYRLAHPHVEKLQVKIQVTRYKLQV